MDLRRKVWDQKVFKYAMISAVLWSLVHVYAFSRLMVSHDSLAEFYAEAALRYGYTGMTWKISLGRVLMPFYQKLIRGTVTLPWMIGLLSSLYMALAVYVTAQIFSLKRFWAIFVSAGVVISNPSVFLQAATFIHDMDINMLALLFSTLAAWCWKEDRWFLLAVGALCVSACMGIYASFLSVTVALVIFVSILDLLNRKDPVAVLLKGIKAIAMILAGLAIYGGMVSVVCQMTGVKLAEGSYNSITNVGSQTSANQLLKNIAAAYRDVIRSLSFKLFGHTDSLHMVSVAAIVLGMVAIAVKAISERIGFFAGAMLAVLLALVPAALNLTMIASPAAVHDLTRYVFVLVYLLVVLVAEQMLCTWKRKGQVAGVVLMACVAAICWQYAVQANQIYLKKDLENQFVSSLMTRIMTRVEQREEYVPGETTLLFAGDMNHQLSLRRELGDYWVYTGLNSSTPMHQWSHYEPYLEYLMGIQVIYADGQMRWDLVSSQQVKDMPIYPQEGFIQMIDDVLVIKVGPV